MLVVFVKFCFALNLMGKAFGAAEIVDHCGSHEVAGVVNLLVLGS